MRSSFSVQRSVLIARQVCLQGVEAQGYERRQKVDLPEIKAHVTEYQAHDMRCPNCQGVTREIWPSEVRALIQFGPTVKGIASSVTFSFELIRIEGI